MRGKVGHEEKLEIWSDTGRKGGRLEEVKAEEWDICREWRNLVDENKRSDRLRVSSLERIEGHRKVCVWMRREEWSGTREGI